MSMQRRPRRNPFLERVEKLVKAIHKSGTLSMGESCQVLDVSPWSIRNNYVPALLDLYEGIIWDGKHFSTKPEPQKPTVDGNLEKIIVDGIIKPLK